MAALLILTLCVSWAQGTGPALLDVAATTHRAACSPFSFLWQNNHSFGSGPMLYLQAHGVFALPLQPWSAYLTPLLCVRGKCRSVPAGVRQQAPWHAQESGTVSASLLAGDEEQRWI